MASLADLFNPSFFIILGIVALLIALVVVYFESKMREQNHKIASMLSLVSTLAEDMNGVKMGLNHLAITSANGGGQREIPHTMPEDLGFVVEEDNSPHLIEVSDDDEDDYDEEESESEQESMDQSELDGMNDDTDDEESNDDEPVKVIKLNISENDEDDLPDPYYEANNLEFNPEDDLEALEDIGDVPELSEEYTKDILRLKYDEAKDNTDLVENDMSLEETAVPSASELKTISINLGEDAPSEQIDYKKLQLTKLRSIAVEKGLATNSDVQKLKKPEILQRLMGVE
jgi:hypothetical protein